MQHTQTAQQTVANIKRLVEIEGKEFALRHGCDDHHFKVGLLRAYYENYILGLFSDADFAAFLAKAEADFDPFADAPASATAAASAPQPACYRPEPEGSWTEVQDAAWDDDLRWMGVL